MSIDNIFKCCKKNNILTGFTGLVLGAYGSYYVMGNYFGAPMNPEIKEPPAPSPDQPNNIQPPIEVPLGQPVTYRDLFYKNKGLVVLGGGLAILSIGSYIVYTSANIFSTKNQIDYLRDQINLKSGDINQLQEQINLKSGNIQQLQEKLNIMQSNEQIQRSQLEQARRENELLEIQKDLTEQDIKDARDDMNKMQEKLDELNKYKEQVDELRKRKDELTRYKEDFEKELDKMLNIEKIDDYDIKGTITYDFKTGVIGRTKIFEFEDELGEKAELLERPQIEVSNELLLKLKGDNSFIQNKFFEAYRNNIPELGEERKIEGTDEIALNTQAVENLYSRFVTNTEFTIEQMLTESVKVTQENLVRRFAHSSYDDLNTFIYYGAMELIGRPNIKINPEKIIYDVAQMQAIYRGLGRISVENAVERISLLEFSGNNFVNRLRRQFQEYIIVIFARLAQVGIERYDEELAKLLYITANNKFNKKSIKITVVPKFESDEFLNQFSKQTLRSLDIYDPVKFSDRDPEAFYKGLAIKKIYRPPSEYIFQSEVLKQRFKHIYDKMIEMMNFRDAYVDFIKIYEKIYSLAHKEQYDKFKENYEKENK